LTITLKNKDSLQERNHQQRLWSFTLFLLLSFCALNAFGTLSPPPYLNAPPPVQLLESSSSAEEIANFNIQYIRNLDNNTWQPYPEEHINLGFVDHPVWIKIKLPPSPTTNTYLLEFANNKIAQIDVYIETNHLSSQSSLSHMQLLESTPLSQRFVFNSNYIFPINLTPDQNTTLYIKVANTYPIKLPIYMWDKETFAQKTNDRTFFNGIYFGSVLIMALYNLCLFFFVKDRSYANYVIFIVTLAIFVAFDKGLTIQYFWYNTPELNHRFYTLAISLGALSSARFTMSFLSLQESAPKVYRGLDILSWCWVAVIIASILSGSPILLGVVFVLLLPGGTALFLAGVYMWKQGMPEASFYTIAWITLVHAVLGYSASFLGFIPYSAWLDNLIQVTNILEAALLSLGLAYRINTLNRDKQKAFTSAKAKSDLLATMSHEIRTPMNGILGMAQLLKDTKLSSQQKHYLKTILGSGQTLLTILNDILDHSKIEAGKLEIESIPFNIRQTLDETASIFATRAADKMLYFNIYMGPTVPLALDGDPTRIRQVLTNLLSNAFKFTDEGSVVVNVTLQEPNNNTPMLLIEVEDQGIGIPKDKLNKLFKSFSQTDASTTRQYGGTGLGLSISKRLVELMGGEIGVKSEASKGSTFWFSIPIVNGQQYMLPSDPTLIKKLSSLNALIISRTARFTTMLEQHAVVWNMHFSHVETIEELRKTGKTSNKNFHYILIELTNQFHDTAEIIRYINQTENFQHAQLIISAPAGTSDSRLDTSQLEKTPWIIDQPFSINRIFYLIFNSQIQSTQKNPIIDISRPFEGRQALVVDDNAVNRQVALAFLKKLGIDAVAVASGQEAIDFICTGTAEHINNTLDLILMDCEMPGVDGFQATRSIRSWEQNNTNSALPIIALSAHAMESHKSACSDAGMNDFIAKPVVFDHLRKTLGEYLK